MKSLIATASALAVAAIAAPAFAQTPSVPPVTGYVNLGYSYADSDGSGLSVLHGRVGATFGKYLGAEGELGFGVSSVDESGVSIKVKDAYAGYLVSHIPLTPQAELFARVGYGHTTFKGTYQGQSTDVGENSWNFGGGGQFFFTRNDGLRAEYTREQFRHGDGAANVWAVSYVRRFP